MSRSRDRRSVDLPAPAPAPATATATATSVLTWFDKHARELPWRAPDRTPWGVLVSEVMLQQTPVARVVPVWEAWLLRWPEPAGLAAESIAEALRAWGRLGYPRRARNLHATAVQIRDQHDGVVPHEEHDLRALPGVGEYTAGAVRSFAFGHRSVVLDTNVRRVLARAFGGAQHPAATITRAERDRAEALLPAEESTAVRWSAAIMEVGALVCTAAHPRCTECPLAGTCAWLARGRPESPRPGRVQRFAGTDRQVRGLIMATLRETRGPVAADQVARGWPDPQQTQRALSALVAEQMVEEVTSGRFGLPGDARRASG